MTSDNQPSKGSDERVLKVLYRRAFFSSFGSGLISPFIPIYATQIGASPSELGLIQAINSVSPSIAQIPWGFLVDKIRRRTLIISVSGLLYASIMLLLLGTNNVLEFILIILSAYLLSAMAAPAINSILGEYSSRVGRARIVAKINAMASLGSMPATVLSGYIIYRVGGTAEEMYKIPLILCFIFNLIASTIALQIKDLRFTSGAFSIAGWARALKTNP
ncbi:MAG: MFS transporter, partial [Candidatus Bathyarchaeia archaeon]